ncbi:uncharacterized protein BDZ99DRAFT_483181 [Mytilinidion resinicola]|uniref:Uncharacterized protein n=1 Tax=Mytilinidion resinicola TaxID=574789 RepID=A0A6A6Y0J5_9PEZI|nr:uncharacterized protein BDZ99DRAFT_483181 [Mytilinidion resinicola]KAF2802170.1 hypothetical protein BDZ99DRAFT_483181 [Mytilinidion resinicola]
MIEDDKGLNFLFTGTIPQLPRDFTSGGYGTRMSVYLDLFGGYHSVGRSLSEVHEDGKASAMSSGGFYCYLEYLRNPFQSDIQCGMIHVGRGSIQLEGRNYSRVHDGNDKPLERKAPKAIAKPRARALVEENISLKCWYEQWDDSAPDSIWHINPAFRLDLGWHGNEGAWPGINMKRESLDPRASL